MTASAMLVTVGSICLFLGGLTLYQALPRHGKPPSAWASSEGRAVGAAMLVLLLLFAGITMLLKAVL